jgi:hypothetical protein
MAKNYRTPAHYVGGLVTKRESVGRKRTGAHQPKKARNTQCRRQK